MFLFLLEQNMFLFLLEQNMFLVLLEQNLLLLIQIMTQKIKVSKLFNAHISV